MFGFSIDRAREKDIPVCRILRKLNTLKDVINNWKHPGFSDAERAGFVQAVHASVSIDVEEAKDYEDWMEEYIEGALRRRDCQSTIAPNELLALYKDVLSNANSHSVALAINEYTNALYDPPPTIATSPFENNSPTKQSTIDIL